MLLLSLPVYSYDLSNWEVCNGQTCHKIQLGTDLYKNKKLTTNKVTYTNHFLREKLDCISTRKDCWLFLGEIADTAKIFLNKKLVANFNDHYIKFNSLFINLNSTHILKENLLEIEVTDLNSTLFGLRSKRIFISSYYNVLKASNLDWFIRTGSTLLSSFSMFSLSIILFLILYFNRNFFITLLLLYSLTSSIYLLSFSEIPRAFLDPVLSSGFIHFFSRLCYDFLLLLIIMQLYAKSLSRHIKISLQAPYIISLGVMILYKLNGIIDYHVYEKIMYFSAPLVALPIMLGFFLNISNDDQRERRKLIPFFVIFSIFQLHDLAVFWQLYSAPFLVKFYSPFLLMGILSTYFKRTSQRLTTLKSDAKVGEITRLISHDLKGPLQNLKTCISSIDSIKDFKLKKNIINENIDLLEQTAECCPKNQSSIKKHELINLDFILQQIQSTASFSSAMQLVYKENHRERVYLSTEVIKLKRILLNLILNADENSATKTTIFYNVNGNNVSIYVSDNGQGIPSHLHQKIFLRGFSSKQNSNGLGLFSSRILVNEMKGSIELFNSTKSETCFRISLPYFIESRNLSKKIDFVFLDDDSYTLYQYAMKYKKHSILLYTSIEILIKDIAKFQTETTFYLDYCLNGSSNGYEAAKVLNSKGFTNINLASNYDLDSMKNHNVFQNVISKNLLAKI